MTKNVEVQSSLLSNSSRRRFFACSAFTMNGLSLETYAVGQTHQMVYFDDAGFPWGESWRNGGKRFIIGAIACSDADRHQKAISNIKKNYNYCLTLKFNGSNRYKMPVAEDVLSYFFKEADLSMAAISISHDDWPRDPQSLNVRYYQWYFLLLKRLKDKSSLMRRAHLKESRDNAFTQRVRETVKLEFKAPKIYEDNIMQMADLLTGLLSMEKSEPLEYRMKLSAMFREMVGKAEDGKLSIQYLG